MACRCCLLCFFAAFSWLVYYTLCCIAQILAAVFLSVVLLFLSFFYNPNFCNNGAPLRSITHKDMEQLRPPTHPKSGAIHMQVALGSELRVHDDALPRSLGVVRLGVKTRCLRIFNHVAQALTGRKGARSALRIRIPALPLQPLLAIS